MADPLRNVIRDYPDLMLVVLIWLVIVILWVLRSKRKLQEQVEARRFEEEKRSSQNRLSSLDALAADPGAAVSAPVSPPSLDDREEPVHGVAASAPPPERAAFYESPAPTPMAAPAAGPVHAPLPADDMADLDMGRVSQQKQLSPEQQALLTQYTSGDGGGVEEMEKMLEKDPHNLQLLDWLAFMYYSNNNAEKAISTYQRILEIDPNNASQHYYLANSYYKVGDCGRAIAHWQRVVELRPDSKYAKKAIDRINKVQSA